MENYRNFFESRKPRDDEDNETDKSKKKRSRIVKPRGILPPVEQPTKSENAERAHRERTLDKLFGYQVSESESESAKNEAAEHKLPEKNVEQDKAGSDPPVAAIPETASEDADRTPYVDELTDFGDEGSILDRTTYKYAESSAQSDEPAGPEISPDDEAGSGVPEGAAERIISVEQTIADPASVTLEQQPGPIMETSVEYPDAPADTLEVPVTVGATGRSGAAAPVPERTRTAAPEVPLAERARMVDPSYAGYSSAPPAPELDMVSRKTMEDEVYYARKRATGRGVLAGGIVGYLLGRRRGKKLAAENRAELGRQKEQIKHLKHEQAAGQERLRAINANQRELEQQVEALKRPLPVEHSSSMHEQSPASRHERQVFTAERQPHAYHPKAEQQEKQTPLEEQPVIEAMFTVPKGRRVELSSWHRIEVDAKTGKTAEDQEAAYGKEFHNEQQPERLRDDAAKPLVAAQIGQAIIQQGTATGVADWHDDARQPVAAAKETQPHGRSAKEYVKQQLLTKAHDPLTWAAAGVILLLLLLIILTR